MNLDPFKRLVLLAVLTSCIPLVASGYLTEGNNPGRTGWMKDEKVFTLANVKDMKLLWKVKLDSQPREMHNLFAPLIAERVTTARGSREVAIVAGISDDLFAIDVASGELLWKKRYESTFAPTDKTVYHTLCLGGQTAVPAMVAGLAGQVHHLCDRVGRAAAPDQRGRRFRCRPS